MFTLRSIAINYKLNIIPIHPDGSGGLSKIGRASLINTYPVVIIGVGIAGEMFNLIYILEYPKLTLYFYLMTIGYFIIGPLIFFFPLSYFHRCMKKKKMALLEYICSLSNEVYEYIESKKSYKIGLFNKLENINSIYKTIETMPVWPFNTKIISRFSITILIPTLSFILTSAMTYLF